MQSESLSPTSDRSTVDLSRALLQRFLWIGTFGLLVIYAVQIFSPLRLNPDAVVLLHLAEKLTDGQPYLLGGVRPVFPVGIPWIFSLMERIGVANSTGFGLLNLICLCFAAQATWIICQRFGLSPIGRLVVILISFSNFVLFKHSMIPLTDIPFMAVSLIAIALMESALHPPNRRMGSGIGLALIFVGLSIITRRIGVALIPAMLFTLWQLIAAALVPLNRLRQVVIIFFVSAVVISGTTASRRLIYIPDMGQRSAVTPLRLGLMRLIDFGELLLNLPVNKLRTHDGVIVAAGAILLMALCVAVWQQWQCRPTVVYFVGYTLILAIWPYGDARFWIPCLPLITLFICLLVRHMLVYRTVRWLTGIYLTAYFLLAAIAAVYTTRITFSGSRFLQIYGSADTRRSYQQAMSGDPDPENAVFAAVLRRFGTGRDSHTQGEIPPLRTTAP